MLKLLLLLCSIASAGLASQKVDAHTHPASEAKQETPSVEVDKTPAEEFTDKISHLKTYQAYFEQRVSNENGREIDFSAGQFTINRPNQFRWHVEAPFEQLIVADGDNIFTYDPELEQVTIQSQGQMLADSPLVMLTSNAPQLADSFEIKVHKLQSGEPANLFELRPKAETSIFESVHILFKDGQIAELAMSDNLGQKTSVIFSEVKTNLDLAPELFKFEVPEGIDVIGSVQAQ